MLERARTYLGVIFAIFARDVRRVLRNPVALVITLGMIVMPSAYAWYVVAGTGIPTTTPRTCSWPWPTKTPAPIRPRPGT